MISNNHTGVMAASTPVCGYLRVLAAKKARTPFSRKSSKYSQYRKCRQSNDCAARSRAVGVDFGTLHHFGAQLAELADLRGARFFSGTCGHTSSRVILRRICRVGDV